MALFNPVRAPAVKLQHNSGGQTISSTTLTRVTFWDTEIYDTDGFHEGAINPSRITIPADFDGTYSIFATIFWGAQTLGTVTDLQVRIYKNGSVVFGGGEGASPETSFATYGQAMNVAIQDRAVAGDYYEVFVFHDKTAAGTLTINDGGLSAFGAARIGS